MIASPRYGVWANQKLNNDQLMPYQFFIATLHPTLDFIVKNLSTSSAFNKRFSCLDSFFALLAFPGIPPWLPLAPTAVHHPGFPIFDE